MNDFKIDPDREIIITCGDLVGVIEGLSRITGEIEKFADEIPEENSHRLMGSMMATFVWVAKLFPTENKREIFEAMKRDLGVDLTGKI